MDPMIGSAIASGTMGIASGVASIFGNKRREKRQHKRQKELMGVQFKNQQALNQQGHELQMDMWNKTNFKAQMEHLKEAGLNPGLMYKQGGQGGTTGSQTGGSAQGGQAPMGEFMDIASVLSAMKLKAEIDNINADTKQKEAGAGRDTQAIEESKQNIAESISRVALNKEKGITEQSKQNLNRAVQELNEQKFNTEVTQTKLNQADLDWMKKNGLNRNDSVVAKTIKYISNKTQFSETEVIEIMGGLMAVEKLAKSFSNLWPTKKVTEFKD